MKEIYKQKLRSALENQGADPPTLGAYIIKGDISGIQDFIFNIQSEGAARMLKARSSSNAITNQTVLNCTNWLGKSTKI